MVASAAVALANDRPHLTVVHRFWSTFAGLSLRTHMSPAVTRYNQLQIAPVVSKIPKRLLPSKTTPFATCAGYLPIGQIPDSSSALFILKL